MKPERPPVAFRGGTGMAEPMQHIPNRIEQGGIGRSAVNRVTAIRESLVPGLRPDQGKTQPGADEWRVRPLLPGLKKPVGGFARQAALIEHPAESDEGVWITGIALEVLLIKSFSLGRVAGSQRRIRLGEYVRRSVASGAHRGPVSV